MVAPHVYLGENAQKPHNRALSLLEAQIVSINEDDINKGWHESGQRLIGLKGHDNNPYFKKPFSYTTGTLPDLTDPLLFSWYNRIFLVALGTIGQLQYHEAQRP